MKVVVAYDGLDGGGFALDRAAEVALGEGADVTVLSVVEPDARGTKSGGHVGGAPHAETHVAYGRSYLAERGVEATTLIAHGEPAEQIVRVAREGGYDLIVVGTRGLGPIRGRLLGSVSRVVAAAAPCPVDIAGESGVSRVEPRAPARV